MTVVGPYRSNKDGTCKGNLIIFCGLRTSETGLSDESNIMIFRQLGTWYINVNATRLA